MSFFDEGLEAFCGLAGGAGDCPIEWLVPFFIGSEFRIGGLLLTVECIRNLLVSF